MEFGNLPFWREQQPADNEKLSQAERLQLLREFRSRAPQLPSGPGVVEPAIRQPEHHQQLDSCQASRSQSAFSLEKTLSRLIYRANPRYLAIGEVGCAVLLVAGIVGWQNIQSNKSASAPKPPEVSNAEPYISQGRCGVNLLLRSYPEIVIVNARVAAPGDQAVSHTLVLNHKSQQGDRSRPLVLSPGSVQTINYQFEQFSPGAQAQIRKGGREMFDARGQHQGEVTSTLPIPEC